jgi:hypothetical protein
MAKRDRVLPARKQRDRSREDESLLIRSAESVGRMIGSLQRQLDDAGKRLAVTADDVMENLPEIPFGSGRDVSRKSGTTARKKTKKTTATKRTAARKGSARKSTAGARKTGSARTSAKTRRTNKSSKKR